MPDGTVIANRPASQRIDELDIRKLPILPPGGEQRIRDWLCLCRTTQPRRGHQENVHCQQIYWRA
jgi:hypothetical protein